MGLVLVGATSATLHAQTARRAPDVPAPRGLEPLGPTPPGASISLTLLLRYPGAAALQHFLDKQHASANPQWLTPAQIGAQYGLPSQRLDDATAALARAGVSVTERFDQRTALLARGSAGALERLFHVTLRDYRTKDGLRVTVPSHAAEIPGDLADVITEVDGLDTRPVFHSSAVPTRVATQSTTPSYLTPKQIASIYGADQLTSRGIDGRGETIAVLSLNTLHGNEVDAWARDFGTRTAPDASVVVQPAAPESNQHGWNADASIEVALDLEMTRALAPAATIINYTSANDGPAMERIVNQVTQDHRATILSASWGLCELEEGASNLQNAEPTYAAAEAAGIDMFASSGDVGPYDCNNQNGDTTDRHLSVDYPASSAHVLGVGGTTLIANGNRLSEEVWQEPQSVVGAGGGVSTYVQRPSWQLDSVVHQNGTARDVPDVAGPASGLLNLGIEGYYKGQNYKLVASGTSAATPFWAGSMALVKEYLRNNAGGFPDGSLKTLIYEIANNPTAYTAAFHDTTQGSNQQYSASPGWDPITGLGSPNIAGLTAQLQALIARG